MKRTLLCLLTMVLLAGLLASACSKPAAPTTTAPAPAAKPAATTPAAKPAVTTPAAKPAPAATAPAAKPPATTPAAKPSPAGKVYTLKVASFVAQQHHVNRNVMVPWNEALKKNSNGRINVEFYPGGVLGSTSTAYEFIKKGMADAGFVTYGYLSDIYPLTMLGQLPFGVTKDAVEGSKAILEIWDEFYAPTIEKDVHAVCTAHTGASYVVFGKKPITKMDDLKGLKTRSAGGLVDDVIELYGAVRVGIPAAEMYEALQRGTLDAGIHFYSGAADYKLWEVTKYVYDVGMAASMNGIHMNKDVYNSLPADLKKVVDDLRPDVNQWMAKSYRDEDISGKKKFTDNGAQITVATAEQLAALREKTAPLWAKWESAMNAKGLPGTKVIAAFKAALKKHGM